MVSNELEPHGWVVPGRAPTRAHELERGTVAHQAPKPRILWITNLAAPYRIPVWRALGNLAAVDVALTESDDHLGPWSSLNRDIDWRSSAYPDVSFISLHTAKTEWRGRPLYFLLPRSGLGRMRELDGVLIGGWEVPAYWQVLALSKLRGVRTV